MTIISQYLSIQEAAKLLELCVVTVAVVAKKGELKGVKIGGKWRFRKEDLEAYVENKFK